MKAKEKGIPDSEVQRGKPTAGGKWNAFREMNKIKSGGSPMLAKIPDGVKVVGTPGGIPQRERDNGRKRNRDDDGEEGSSKREKVDVRCTAVRLISQLTNRSQRPSSSTTRARMSSVTRAPVRSLTVPSLDSPWRLSSSSRVEQITQIGRTSRQVCLLVLNEPSLTVQEKILTQITKPFMAFPPGATVGNLAKQDDAQITDEDIAKLNDAKFQFGGADAVFSRMTGKSHPSRVSTKAD
jgi:hypothetical protein